MNEATKKQEKNARKREKAKEKKLKERVEARKMEEEAMATNMVVVDPTIEVKQQLAEAKASGDHKLAAKLRQDLWVLQDASTGHSIKLDSEDIKESMNRLEKVKTPVTKPQQSKPKQLDDIISSGKAPSERKEKTDRKTKKPSKQQLEESTAEKVAPEKEIKKLKKKLEQIERLKQKEASGETLEECQAEKISKESEFKELLAKLEKSL